MSSKPSQRLLLVFTAFLLATPAPRAARPVQATSPASLAARSQGPSITSARLQGNRVVVNGENFSDGGLILINGKKQRTESDPSRSTRTLIAPEAGARVPRGEIVMVQVRNPDGSASQEFPLFSGRVVSLEDGGKTIRLRIGERFLLNLQHAPYDWTATVQNPSILRRLGDSRSISGSQGIFEALKPGRTNLSAAGELPCHKVNPPCMAATLDFEVKFVVE